MTIAQRILAFLKPTLLTLFFFILALKLVPVSWQEVIPLEGSDAARESSTNWGGALQLHYDDAGEFRDYSVDPGVMLTTLWSVYAIALLLSKWVKRAKWLKWWAIALVAPIAIGGASIIAKRMWGFYFFRPSASAFASHFRSVDAIAGVTTGGREVPPKTFLPDTEFSIAKALKGYESDPYYGLSGRILDALRERNLLPAATATIDGLPELFRAVEASGELIPADSGYGPLNQLKGVVVEGQSEEGSKLLFVGVQSPQLSNDHYAWYEMLFARTGDGQLTLLRAQHFFFDWAGMELFTFESMALGFVCMAYLFVLPVVILLVEIAWFGGRLLRKCERLRRNAG